jgi:hypothetical protein
MVVIERMPGLGVQIGRYTLQVLAVHAGEVVVALLDPDKDCAGCGERPADRRRCPGCGAEAVVCPACAPVWRCPRCVPRLE